MFGIRPWEVERLRPDELDAMRSSLDARTVEDEYPVGPEDDLEATPVFDEIGLPDPFRAPPRGLGGP